MTPEINAPDRKPSRLVGIIWIAAALAALVPIAAIGFYSLNIAQHSLWTLIESDNHADAISASDFLRAFVNADAGLLRTISSFPAFNAAVRASNVPPVKERLKFIIACNPGVDRAFVLDADGVMWCDWPEIPEALGKNEASRDYFSGAVAGRGLYLSRVFERTQSPREPLKIAVSIPVLDDQQQVRGVLVLEHRLESVTGSVSHVQGAAGSFVVVLDQNGAVAGHPTLDLFGAPYQAYGTLPSLRQVTAGAPASTEYIDPVLQRDVIATVQAVDLAAGSRWLVLAEQDKAQAYAAVRRLRTHIALAAGAVALLAIAAAVTLARISQRSRRLAIELTDRNAALQDAMARQKQVEAELEKERFLFQTLMDNLPHRIYFKDANSRFIKVNKAMLSLFKVTDANDVIGKTDSDFFSPEEAARSLEDERQVITTGEAIIDKIKKKSMPDGRTYWVANTKAPLRDAAGNISGSFGLSHDVTRLMTAEDELRKANTVLEKKNEDLHAAHQAEVNALAELKEAQGQLVQSAKLAGLGEMVAGVAHEINNPLAFVSNNVVVLKRDVGGVRRLFELYRQTDPLLEQQRAELFAQIKELADEIDLQYILENLDGIFARSTDGLKRIAEIVQGLRTFARTDDGALRLEPMLNDGIESTLTIARGRATKKKVRLEFTRGDIPPLVCNLAKLNQVVMNLVANAIDASNENTAVAVRSYADEKNVNIEVTDHGCGMDPAVRAHLFEPFYTTKPQGQGVGLGLSISYGIIVKTHSGTIDVASTPGEGSTFTIRIPRSLAPGKS
jgi:PAS domain S-box-containing protein